MVSVGSSPYRPRPSFKCMSTVVRNIVSEQTSSQKREKLYVYKSTLAAEYGLTPKMIDELGGPDDWCENPHYKSGPPANLYLISRVEAWISDNQEHVDRARAARARRSAATKAVHDRKRAERDRIYAEQLEKAREWMRGVAVTVQQPLPDTLVEDAHRRFASQGQPDGPTERQIIAHVRHQLTNFEDLRHELRVHEFRHEHRHELHALLRERVDAVITNAVLEWRRQRECERQHLMPAA